MRKIFNFDFEWKFKKENDISQCNIDDYFGMFNDNTKTGVEQGAKSALFYDGEWEDVNLPHDWCLSLPKDPSFSSGHGHYAQGAVWYRKSFIADRDFLGKTVYLKFDGIAVESEIWLNDIKIAESSSAYTNITVDITDFLVYGGYNVVSVRCDNSIKEGWWYEGGGIYRHSYLIVCETSHFADNGVFIKPQKSDNNQWIVDVVCDIVSPDGCKVVTEFEGCEYEGNFTVDNPRLWSVDSPGLYTAVVKLYKDGNEVDSTEVTFGFREIRFDSEKGLFLNGENIKMKGFCLHHDHACVGVAVPEAVIEYRMKKLREIGCNAIRTSHNPKSPEFYNVCDRMGFLVMDEVRHFSSTKTGLHELSEFIKRDRNHPSVIMWSIYNEEPLQDTINGELMAKRMKAVINSLDGTRAVTGAMNGGPFGGEGVIKAVDVFGMNYLQYTYDKFHKAFPDIPLFGSENASYLTTRGVTETEERQIAYNGRELFKNLLKWSATPGETWRDTESRDFVAGCFSWTGFDYRGECSWPSVNCNFGAFDLCGFPKGTAYWYKALWCSNPVIHIEPRWEFEEGSRVYVTCYSNVEDIVLILNGKTVKEYKNDKYNPENIELTFESGILEARGFINGVEVCDDCIVTPGAPEKIAVLLSKEAIKSDRRDAIVAEIHLEDEHGNPILTVDETIKIETVGGIKLMGVGNGNPIDRDIETLNSVKLFNGYAQAVFCSDGTVADAEIIITSGDITKRIGVEVLKTDIAPYIPSCGCRIPLNQWRRSDVVDYYPEGHISNMHFAWIPLNISLGNPFSESGEAGHCLVAIRYLLKTDYVENTYFNLTGLFGKNDIYINDKLILKDAEGTVKLPLGKECFGSTGCISIVFNTDGEEFGINGEAYISFGE